MREISLEVIVEKRKKRKKGYPQRDLPIILLLLSLYVLMFCMSLYIYVLFIISHELCLNELFLF